MKIAMIGQKGFPATFGGVERHVEELSKRLALAGFAVRVYARHWYTKKNQETQTDIEVVHVRNIRTKYLDTISHTLFATLDAMASDVDVIHYHGVGPSLLSWLPRLFTPQIHIVTTFHSIDRKHEKWGAFARAILRFGEWTACRFADQTIAVSKTIRQYARDVYDREALYIPNAVPLYTKAETTAHLDRWGITPGNYILMTSRLIPHKGAHYLISAWQMLRQTQPVLTENIQLVVVGDGHYTSAYTDELRKMARRDTSIVFTGFQSGEALRELFSHTRLMVHPSDQEGMPLTVLEGMSYGLPVLLSDIPEHLELANGADEYLFAHGQVRSLKDRLQELLKKNEEELRTQGNTNRTLIENEFTWDIALKDILSVYANSRKKISAEPVKPV